MKYVANNLGEIAATFEGMAEQAESACNAELVTKMAQYGFKREAAAYRACAAMLRKTKLVQ